MATFQIIENVKIPIRAELDQKTISFSDLLNLRPGSILELRRPTGENVDVYAGRVLLGNGEILVIDSNLAVRIADLFHKHSAKDEDPAEPSKSPTT